MASEKIDKQLFWLKIKISVHSFSNYSTCISIFSEAINHFVNHWHDASSSGPQADIFSP